MAIGSISGYELLEVLGEGPHGVVYKARELKTSRLVGLKVFHSEARDLTAFFQLKHPHLAPFCDAGWVESQSFAVTEYLAGGALKDHIRSMQTVGDVFPPEQILAYAAEIGEALVYAHCQDLAHGDVKSENVMFSEDGVLKLMDFSPEPRVSVEADQERDLLDFGALLYELATGKLPFPGIKAAPISQVRKDVPVAFSDMVSRVLDRDRQDHYKNVCAVLADLK